MPGKLHQACYQLHLELLRKHRGALWGPCGVLHLVNPKKLRWDFGRGKWNELFVDIRTRMEGRG
eukprot:7125396-Pyramimonas_sp.AAC.1